MSASSTALATALVHAAPAAAELPPLATPVVQSASFRLPDLDAAGELYGPAATGDVATYSRYGNPTVAVFEARAAALEGGIAAVATASGMAAIALTLFNLLEAGDNVICQAEVYGSTRALLAHALRRLGIEARFVPGQDPTAFAAAADERTRCLYAETIANPSLRVVDVPALAELADRVGVPLVADNTAAPMLCRPIELGATLVIHSATKYIGGHGGAVGGVVVDSGRFDWAADPARFGAFRRPDPSYHGAVWTDVAGEGSAFCVRLRRSLLRDFGSSMAPFNAAEFIRGLESLPVRVERMSRSAAILAQALRAHPAAAEVLYPDRDPVAARVLSGGHGGLVAIRVRGGLPAARAVVSALELITHVVNIGDARTLVTWPAGTTHGQLTPSERRAAGVPNDLLRLSVGLEAPEDLLADLNQALDAAASGGRA